MDKQSIIEFLEDNNFSDIEEIKVNSTDEILGIKFFYDFDKDEINAAKAYASEETDYDENDTQWIATGIIPYLEYNLVEDDEEFNRVKKEYKKLLY